MTKQCQRAVLTITEDGTEKKCLTELTVMNGGNNIGISELYSTLISDLFLCQTSLSLKYCVLFVFQINSTVLILGPTCEGHLGQEMQQATNHEFHCR